VYLILFAQDVGAAGLAGWSSFGLAGLVLGWLFLVHLPAKDKQLSGIIKEAADRADAADKAHAQDVREQRAEFRAALEVVVGNCAEQARQGRESSGKDIERVMEAVERLAEAIKESRRP
jgi:predicted HicB family RNase H-like nuclease